MKVNDRHPEDGNNECRDDAELAELIEELTRRMQAGDSQADFEIIAIHPEFRDELTQLRDVVRELAECDAAAIAPSSGELVGLNASSEYDIDAATRVSTLRPGNLKPADLLGDFRILRELGRGGMGVVYEAHQISLGRRVALKTLPSFSMLDSRSTRRFENEARAAALLDHQNIVRVHAVGFDCGVHYYAMQLINGTDLEHVIAELRETLSDSRKNSDSNASDDTSRADGTPHGSRDTCALFGLRDSHSPQANQQYIKTFARLGIQAAEALEHAHLMGIVHRDIKPSNLLLDAHGNIQVADFGLAQIQGEAGVSATGDVVGTLRYMSPEQAYAKRVVVDHRTDIYSLGVTLYELLTLQRAFDGANRVEVLRKIAFDDPAPPRQLNKRIPIELDTIVMKAMAKSPDQRYQSASELAADLRRFSNSEPILAKPLGRLDYAKKWCRRHKSLVSSMMVVLAFIFLGSVISSAAIWVALQRSEELRLAEVKQRQETARLWRKAEGLRLATLSSVVRPKDPGLAFSMAIEGHRLYPYRDVKNALLAAYESNFEHRTLLGHLGVVGSVSFDNKSEKLVTTASRTQFGLRPESARIWNVATGQLLAELQPGETSLTSAVFSPGGVRILATSAPIAPRSTAVDGTDPRHHPSIWDSLTGNKLLTLTDSYLFDAHAAAFDTTGKRVVTPGRENTAKIWDTLEGQVLVTLTGHTKRVVFAAFDASGERVVTVSDDQTVRIWRAKDGESLLRLENWNHSAKAPVFAVFSPDGTKLATETTEDGIQLWDVTTGVRLHKEQWPGAAPRFTLDGSRIVHTKYSNTVVRTVHSGQVQFDLPGQLAALSADGAWVATVKGTNVNIWNIDTGELAASLHGHSNDITAATFNLSSKLLATASYDHSARIWQASSGAARLGFDASLLVHNPLIAENKDGTLVATTTSPRVRTQIIDIDSDRAVMDVEGTVWNSDIRGGRLLTTVKNRAHLYDAISGEQIAQFEHSKQAIVAAQLSRDGRRALIVSEGGPSWLWQIDSNERTTLIGPEETILDLDWSPNNKLVVTCSEGGMVRIWDAATGTEMGLLKHPRQVVCVRIHPDSNRLATVMSNDEGAIWDLESGQQVAAFHNVDGIPFSQVEFSASGDRIFGYSEELSQGVLCWKFDDGEVVGSISPIRGRVRIGTSLTGGRIVIASSVDGSVIWDPDGERQVLTENASSYAAFLSEERVVVAPLGLERNPESLGLEDRRKFTTPQLQVFNVDDGKHLKTLATPCGWAVSLGVEPTTQRVLVAGAFQEISIFDADTHRLVTTLRGHSAPLSFLGFAHDAVVTTSWDGTASIWDGSTGALRRQLICGSPVSAAAVSSDGTQLAVGDATGNVYSWAIDEAKPRVDWKPHLDLVKAVAFQPNANDRLLTSSIDRTTILRQPGRGVTQLIESRGAIIGQIRFTENGEMWLLVPVHSMTVELSPEALDAHSGDLPLKLVNEVIVYENERAPRAFGTKSAVVAADFRKEGRELVTIASQEIIIWDVAEHRPLREIEVLSDAMVSAGVSANGMYAFTEHRQHIS